MKGRILSFLPVFLLATFLGSLRPLRGEPTATSEAYRIGFVYSKTGRLAPYSKSVSQGAKLALQLFRREHPELASKVQMIAADDESTIAGANKAAGRLLGRQSVHVLIGSFANVLNLPLLVLSKHYQTPLLMPRATDEALIGQTVAYSLTPDDQRQGRLLAQFILKHLKVNQAAILIESQKPDANDILEGFRTTWGEQGGQILGLWDFSPGQTNIGTLFQDMAAKSPPVVVVLSSVAHASLFLDRAKQNFIQAPWIASDAWDDSRLGDLEAGLPTPYFFSYFHKLDPLPSVQIFAQAYYETYNVFPDQFAAKGFEATKIALEAFLIRQKTGKNLFDILDTETFQGLQNAGRFSKDKVFLQAHPFLRITSGKYKVMNRILLQD